MSRCKGRLTVAIDGPAGAGKSTIARAVADALDYTYVDTGAMYRAAALTCLRQGVDLSDHEAVFDAVSDSSIQLIRKAGQAPVVELDGEDVSDAIRSNEVSEAVSLVAQVPRVRTWLVDLQRKMGLVGGIVMDGRDIGTVVLPEAEVKVFLTASSVERARRRHKELVAAGQAIAFEEVLQAIERRDELDRTRSVSPLRQAEDAVVIDTTDRDVEDVLASILDLCRGKGGISCSTD